AEAMATEPNAALPEAIAQVAVRRPVCFTPLADSAGAGVAVRGAWRVGLQAGAPAPEAGGAPSFVDLLSAPRRAANALAREAVQLYAVAARRTRLLCTPLLAQVSRPPAAACGH